MSAPNLPRVGILGAGRIGRALGARLQGRAELAFADSDPRRAKQAAKFLGAESRSEEELIRFADYLLVCIPPERVADFFRRRAAASPGEHHPVYVNLATSVDTPALLREEGIEGITVVGLKTVGQHVALARGLPALFVTAHPDPEALRPLRALFEPLGPIVVGDEAPVRTLNRLATRRALELCRSLAAETAYPPEWIAAALHGVAVGTILDYPPSQDNSYVADILREISQEEAAAPAPPR